MEKCKQRVIEKTGVHALMLVALGTVLNNSEQQNTHSSPISQVCELDWLDNCRRFHETTFHVYKSQSSPFSPTQISALRIPPKQQRLNLAEYKLCR